MRLVRVSPCVSPCVTDPVVTEHGGCSLLRGGGAAAEDGVKRGASTTLLSMQRVTAGSSWVIHGEKKAL